MLYSFVINRKPVSWNSAYRKLGKGQGMFMTKEGTQYKNFVMSCCKSQVTDFQVLNRHVLQVKFAVCLPTFVTKKGESSKTAGDGDNFWKLTADAMCKSLGIDDSLIWDVRLVKVYQEVPRTFVELKWISMEKYFDPYDFIHLE